MPAPALILQTTYAELLDRCAQAVFAETFSNDGVFTPKTVRGRRYWYFQLPTKDGRGQKYVGPETPELLQRIERQKTVRGDERERRTLVTTIVRSFGMPEPIPEIGNIVEALAKAGVFRLRAVLVGTVAYQTYSSMLGNKLPVAMLQTGDVDIAQFGNVSVAVGDKTPPVLDVLREADKSFRAVPTIHGEQVTSYAAKGGLRVDFLTPNEGPDTDKPQRLPALQTDAQPLRFLDYLIRDPEPAVLLYSSGIYVNVPPPQRYAVHKLMIARRRPEGAAKRDKDMRQAEGLLNLLLKKRRHELKSAWDEAYQRGKEWQRLLSEGLDDLSAPVREEVVALVGPVAPKPKRRSK